MSSEKSPFNKTMMDAKAIFAQSYFTTTTSNKTQSTAELSASGVRKMLDYGYFRKVNKFI